MANGYALGLNDPAPEAPQAPGHEQDDRNRRGPQNDQIPGAKAGQIFAQDEEDDGADDRTFEAADVADNGDEDDVDRPVGDAEGGGDASQELANLRSLVSEFDSWATPA